MTPKLLNFLIALKGLNYLDRLDRLNCPNSLTLSLSHCLTVSLWPWPYPPAHPYNQSYMAYDKMPGEIYTSITQQTRDAERPGEKPQELNPPGRACRLFDEGIA